MNRIYPAIMVIDPFNLLQTIKKLEKMKVECLHADILDGVFTPYISMGQSYFESIANKTTIPIEVHLQVDNPIKQLKYLKIDLFNRIIIHAEKINNPSDLNHNYMYGIALNPETSLEELNRYFDLANIDKIVLMASKPGTSNIVDSIFKKISLLDNILKKKDLRSKISIQIDAGIREHNLKKFISAGADEFVCASALFHNDEIEKNYEHLMAIINSNRSNSHVKINNKNINSNSFA